MKPTIAIDIDDVLADNAAGFVRFSNERWGTHLTVQDYSEHWAEMWQLSSAETEQRSVEFHQSKVVKDYVHDDTAIPVLRALRTRYRLVVVTSRRRSIEQETMSWLAQHYGGIFDEVHFAGFWDTYSDGQVHLTKGELCQQIGADFLIDDQRKHVEAAADAGLKGILFGDYSWNQAKQLPAGVTRCVTWAEVAEYFNVAG